MNILVISNQRWDSTNSVGNTLSNLFEDWPCAEDTFYNIYTRAGVPTDKTCNAELQIQSVDIVKHFLNPSNIGRVQTKQNHTDTTEVANEKSLISFIHNHRLRLIYYINALLWKTRIWKNKHFDSFVKQANPDVVFALAIGVEENYEIISSVLELTSAKLVLFILDDVCGKHLGMFDLIGKSDRKHVVRLIQRADRVYAITEEMRVAYQESFKRNLHLLHKGANLEFPVMNNINTPIHILYAGNLLYGREETLLELAKTIGRMNELGPLFDLTIHSLTNVCSDTERILHSIRGVCLKGPIPYAELVEEMRNSDIVMHIESFEEQEIDLVKYSFSTKITDCIQSGTAIMGIGPDGIASMQFLKRLPGAIVITDINQLEVQLQNIAEDPQSLVEMARSIREYAERNLDRKAVQIKLMNDLHSMLRQ